jgi:ABC-type sugar transport system ATPase subunit
MMFENYALYPHFTVFENMASPYRSRVRKSKYSLEEVERMIRDTARLLSIEELLDRYPKELSGGQKQRAALGRALVRRPSVFLLDEPISHLDAKLRHNMRTELKKIHEEVGVSFIYATPDHLEAMSMADIIAVMNEGEIQQIGTPQDIFDKPANEFVAGFIGDPPMNLFDCSLESQGGELTLRMETQGIVLPKELAARLLERKRTGDLRVGIRPTNIHPTTEKWETAAIQAQVYITEPLGRYSIVTVKVNHMLLKIKTRGILRVKEGDTVWLGLDADKFHFFEKETGVAVAHN